MSLESLKAIIGRAMLEPEFRKQLFDEPAVALKGYELTDQERAALLDLPKENFEALAGELGERISRSGFYVATAEHPDDPLARGRKSRTYEKMTDVDITS